MSCSGQAYINIVVEAPVQISGGADEICVGTSSLSMPILTYLLHGKWLQELSIHFSSYYRTFSYNFATAVLIPLRQLKWRACESNPIQVKYYLIHNRYRPIVGKKSMSWQALYF
ncbi:hypothetical protein EJ377_02920 [Chryseobacterium arthrosphaerae]|uniref:Uncharacterized protein n=1 Tax=Chryseobacterium arthrosphaerae TaxID=651561 RepID=A0A3S0Q7D6_9FLAO|nr:hypothetical protein EJ377_02920 [Chryseobacterium arthrosphaerae]